jgi:hypothetical protein
MAAPYCATVVSLHDLLGDHLTRATMSSMLTSGEEDVIPLTTFKQRLYQRKCGDCHAEPCHAALRLAAVDWRVPRTWFLMALDLPYH